jgi:hypothetical protein
MNQKKEFPDTFPYKMLVTQDKKPSFLMRVFYAQITTIAVVVTSFNMAILPPLLWLRRALTRHPTSDT